MGRNDSPVPTSGLPTAARQNIARGTRQLKRQEGWVAVPTIDTKDATSLTGPRLRSSSGLRAGECEIAAGELGDRCPHRALVTAEAGAGELLLAQGSMPRSEARRSCATRANTGPWRGFALVVLCAGCGVTSSSHSR